MAAKWEVYKGISRPMNFPVISILRTGMGQLNPLALQMLGENARYVELLYDRERKRIGLRPLSEVEPHARKVSRAEHTASINLKGFLDNYGIDYKKTRRYRAEKDEDGILAINLANPL